MDRSTPAGKLRAIVTLLDLGANQVAARLTPELLADQLDMNARAELVNEFGPGQFLKLVQLERPGSKDFAGMRTFALACLDAAAEKARDPKQIAALVSQLQADDAAKRHAAMVDLRSRGAAGIGGLFTALANAEDEELRRAILLTLAEMRPALDGPLAAGLAEGSGQFQRDLADLAGELKVADASLWLAALAAAEPPSAAGVAVRSMIARRGLAPSTPDEVAAAVQRRLADLQAGVPAGPSDAEGLSTWWSWDAKSKRLSSRQVEASELQILTGARLLDAVAAAQADGGALLIPTVSYRLERAAFLHDELPQRERDMLGNLAFNDVSAALAEASLRGHFRAAKLLAAELGRRKDFAALVTLDGRPSPLAAAAASPNRGVRFAALEAIMVIDPQTSFAGASHVGEALWYFAAGGGRPAAIVASSRVGRATDWAGQLRAAGYDAEATQTGLAAIRTALDPQFAGRLALVAFDGDLGSPDVGELLYQLRTHPAAQHVPIAVLSSIYRLPDAERWAEADGRTIAEIYPVDAERMAIIAERASALAPPLASEEEREAQASQALKWLGERLAADGPYDELARNANVAARLLLEPELTAAALTVLEQIGTHDAQTALVEAASNAALPIAARTAAVDALAVNLKSHPLELTRAQVLQQYDRYNASESADAETQQALGRILDLIEGE